MIFSCLQFPTEVCFWCMPPIGIGYMIAVIGPTWCIMCHSVCGQTKWLQLKFLKKWIGPMSRPLGNTTVQLSTSYWVLHRPWAPQAHNHNAQRHAAHAVTVAEGRTDDLSSLSCQIADHMLRAYDITLGGCLASRLQSFNQFIYQVGL